MGEKLESEQTIPVCKKKGGLQFSLRFISAFYLIPNLDVLVFFMGSLFL
ncbi:hypothetical protein QYF53_12190 [Paenibacillus polymyxa]|nr:hypothetical protein [Paenibacillus polymyxa]